MTILITGPTGGTGRALATLVSQSSHPFLLAMRRPEKAPPGMSASRFDWSDESTYAKPFEDANAKGKPVTAVYLIAPTGAPDPGALMTRFIDQAVDKHGVKRFVFCGGGSLRVDGPYLGEFLRHVLNLVENKGLEWCLLRATWFDENFTDPSWLFPTTIREESRIYTAAEDGKSYFVATRDIARVALRALTMKETPRLDYHVLGPELLSYDDIAQIFSTALGRKITHVRLSAEERKEQILGKKQPEAWANLLVFLEQYTAQGNEERVGAAKDDVWRVTGEKPLSVGEYVRENIGAWTK